ncbi:MAG: sortase [bacterium]|nr:sortase [bacterium]MDZ4342311.1 sortase [Candidatus Binatia bacterium]
MKQIIRFALNLLIVLLVLSAGIFFGFYYHNEIEVLWQGIVHQPDATTPAAPLPSVDPTQDSYINLPSLDQPLPLVFSETLDEPTIQEYLKQGAVVLPLGTTFGETGNVVVTAHSSGATNFGPYRFAFAKISELKDGDDFTVHTPQAIYTYRVYGQEIVWPTQVDKLPNDDRSTVTLVTCWPLWTNFKRLLVNSELTRVDYK